MQARSYKGFTLVELVVTLVIIGALAAVSAPIFFSADTFRQRGFFNETLSAVRYAQKLAVASGCTVSVSITASGFSVNRAAGNTPPGTCNTGPYGTVVTDPSNPGQGLSRSAPAGVAIAPVTSIIFTSLGNASTGDATITVGGSQFRVWGATGFVERL